MSSLRARLDRLARAASTEDSAGRLVTILIHGEGHRIVPVNRWAMSLVVPWSEHLERGGADAALESLTADQRGMIRPQDKVSIVAYPPGSDPPRLDRCGL